MPPALVGRKNIYCLAFADIIIMAYSAVELKDMIKVLQRFANKKERRTIKETEITRTHKAHS